MNKKKVIHLIQALDNGGCENMLLRTIPLLNNFEHEVVTLHHQGELSKKFRGKKIPIINIGQKNLLDIFSYFKLLEEIKKEKPAIILTYLFHADAIGRLFLQVFTRIKIIPFLRTTYNHKKYWVARIFEKLTKYFVKNYLANSESVKNFYVEKIGIPAKKITSIPNGIDVAYYDSVSRDENFRERLGINSEELGIICVANLHINKGHKYLLEAFESAYCEDKNIKLLLVGDGNERENLQKQIENYQSKNNILFLGRRTDVPSLLKISEIFVLPTLFEGMNNAIMEAMASGLPIITSDIPENKELIENKKNGILIKPKNAEKIAQEIIILINDKETRIELGRAAKVLMKDKFGLEKVSEIFKHFLTKMS